MSRQPGSAFWSIFAPRRRGFKVRTRAAGRVRTHGDPAVGRIVPSGPTAAAGPPGVCTVTGQARARIQRTPDHLGLAPAPPASDGMAPDARPSPPRARTTSAAAGRTPSPRRRRTCYSWSELLQRVLRIDALVCGRCGDRMQILGVVESPDAIRAILTSPRLLQRAPPDPLPPARDAS